jgi:hypothetical protein
MRPVRILFPAFHWWQHYDRQELNALMGADDAALKCTPTGDECLKMRLMLQVASPVEFACFSSLLSFFFIS